MLDLPEISSLELSDFPDRQRSISFDDSIQVCEFVAVDLDPSIVSWSLPERPVLGGGEASDAREEEEPHLDLFEERIQKRRIRGSVTLNIGLRSDTSVPLSMRSSGLWQRRSMAAC